MPPRSILAFAAAVSLAGTGVAVAAVKDAGPFGSEHVGRQADGSVLTASNQRITPAGTQVEFPGRPNAVTLRPDGRTAALLNGSGAPVTIVDVDSGKVVQRFSPGGASGSYDGIAYSADGRELFASATNGTVLRMTVADDGTLSLAARLAIPAVKGNSYPGGLAPSADGTKLYVALSRDNALGVIDLATNRLAARIPVGNAPHAVVVDGNRAYVSNQGGRTARAGDFTVDSGGTPIVADRETGDAATGTVSVVDLDAAKTIASVGVGLQPTALLLHGSDLLVANSSSDTISVVDTKTLREASSFEVLPVPGAPHGSSPNALAMVGDHTLAVSLGRNNAIGLYDWGGSARATRFDGLIPTAWYPGGLASDAGGRRLIVANTKGVGSVGGVGNAHNVYDQIGSASIVPAPDREQLDGYTAQVMEDNDWRGLPRREGGMPRPDAKPTAIPERIGEPSPIKHVFYVVKENRTYDQVLGDLGRGDGDPSLTQFGKTVTPNAHALAAEFPLMDNFYVSGTNSADGHQWATQAFAPDYLEKAYGGFVRSYPFNGGDSLAYSDSGFLWENALRHGKAVRAYGEYANAFSGPSSRFGTWSDWYHDAQALKEGRDGDLHVPLGTFQTHSDVPSLDRLLNRDFPNYQLAIPDQYRTEIFLREFRQYVANGNLPSLVTMTLPTDHTTGVSTKFPSPLAEVADNDLALGRIVDAISHSPYWKSSAIFVTEDDAQAGADHIDGHRTTGFVVSPYAKHGAIESRYFTQVNMVRTIEQILGLPPMNQMDLVAPPMRSLFTDEPDVSPYDVKPNQVPLDQGLAPAPAPATAGTASAARTPKGRMRRLWVRATSRMPFGRKDFVPDSTPEMTLNHAVWYATNGFDTPYPGEHRVLTPAQVRARYHETGAERDRGEGGPRADRAGRARRPRSPPRRAPRSRRDARLSPPRGQRKSVKAPAP